MQRALSFVAFLLPFTLSSQTATGVLTGTITDSSGAPIPGASVTATNQATRLEHPATTNMQGIYVIPALPAGDYDVKASHTGFGSKVTRDVKLDVQARRAIDFTLDPGTVTEAVEVIAAAPLLESETSSVGQVVTSKTMVDLPINGRNYSTLAVLAPGAIPNPRSRATDGFSLNGARVFQTQYLIDGIDNNNSILGTDTGSTQVIRPPVDAIQEFKLESANYSAEFGRAQGGVVIVSMKSGTGAYRGSVYEFLRNNALDANDFFANRTGTEQPPLRQHQYGATFGGPIIRQRTFFFLSYQGTRSDTAATRFTTVPTAAIVQGDFGSTPIFDPLNVINGARQQFPDNRLPLNRMDPVAVGLASLYPAPNLSTAVNNYVVNKTEVQREHQGDVRIDHRIGDADAVFGRVSVFRRTRDLGSFFAAPGNGGNGFGDYPLLQTPKGFSVVLNHTHIFTGSVINELRAGYTRNESDQLSPSAMPLYDEFGIRGVPMFDGLTGLPSIQPAGFSTLGDRTFAPNPKLTQVRQIIENLSILRGKHSLKVGGDVRFNQNFAGTSSNARGTLNFNGQFTRGPAGGGSSFADFLLGQTSNATLTTLLQGSFRDRSYNFFIQDDWKIARTLTLNLGVRYEMQTPMWESNDNLYNFILDPSNADYGMLVRARAYGDGIFGRSFSRLDRNNWSPRVGFAWQISPATVLRAGAGIFYGGYGWSAIAQSLAANPPNFVSVNFPSANTANRSSLVLSEGFPAGTLDPINNASNPNLTTFLEDYPLPTTNQWNIGVQHQVTDSVMVSAAYVGNGTSYLPGFVNVNQPPPAPGAINPRRPFPTYGNITMVASFAHSTYHALQAKVERRFSKGLALLSSYTWSKALDNSSSGEDNGTATNPQDSMNWRAEKGLSNSDVRHRWVTSGMYEVPIGRGKPLLQGNRILRAILGDVQLGGIFVISSGVPFSPGINGNPANTVGGLRPDRVADGNLPRDERSVDRWFDVSAFRTPEPFTFGNAGRHILIAPGLVNLDGIVQRNFPIGEDRRLELRGEFFNLANTPHFGIPNATTDLEQGGQITSTASPARQVQIGLRLQF